MTSQEKRTLIKNTLIGALFPMKLGVFGGAIVGWVTAMIVHRGNVSELTNERLLLPWVLSGALIGFVLIYVAWLPAAYRHSKEHGTYILPLPPTG